MCAPLYTQEYCLQIRGSMWGGEHELQALSCVLQSNITLFGVRGNGEVYEKTYMVDLCPVDLEF